jgi:flagellar motility protein MotE (MotC chaperone)
MIRILQSKWAAAIAGVLAYTVVTWVCLQPHKQLQTAVAAMRAAVEAAGPRPAGPSWTFHNPELNQLLAELKDEREALRVRATQLDELQARLNSERQEICQVTQTVFQLRKELDATVARVTDEEATNLKKLAKVYGTMSPQGAARILKEMEDDQIVKILALMKEAETAPILENFGQGEKQEAKRAAQISDRLRLVVPPPKKGAAS